MLESWFNGGGEILLRQEELAFIKPHSSVEISPLFLSEMKKAVTAGKKKMAHKVKASAPHRGQLGPYLPRPTVA